MTLWSTSAAINVRSSFLTRSPLHSPLSAKKLHCGGIRSGSLPHAPGETPGRQFGATAGVNAQSLRFKPVTISDLIREGQLLEVHCASCRPEHHLYIDAQPRPAEALPV